MSQNEIIDNIKKFDINQQIAAGGALLAAISVFLPFYGAGRYSDSLSDGFIGWLLLFASIAAIGLVYLKKYEIFFILANMLGGAFVALFFFVSSIDGLGTKVGAFLGLVGAAAVVYGALRLKKA